MAVYGSRRPIFIIYRSFCLYCGYQRRKESRFSSSSSAKVYQSRIIQAQRGNIYDAEEMFLARILANISYAVLDKTKRVLKVSRYM